MTSAKTTKLLEHIDVNLHDLEFGNGVLAVTPKAQATTTK